MTKPDLKDKTAMLRQKHILEAAIRVFERQGFRGATIRNIAEEAGVADGTIYNVFKNKEALLLGVLDELLRETPSVEPSEQAAPKEVKPVFEQLVAARWKQITPETLSMIRVIWAEALTDRSLAARYVENFIQPALDGLEPLLTSLNTGSTTSVPELALQQRMVLASFLGLTMMKLFDDPVLDVQMDDVPAALSKFILSGLSNHSNDEVQK